MSNPVSIQKNQDGTYSFLDPQGNSYTLTIPTPPPVVVPAPILTVTPVPVIPPIPPTPPVDSQEPVIPADAVTTDMLQKKWSWNKDPGTPGVAADATGTSVYPFTRPDGLVVMRNTMTLNAKAGIIYHVNVMPDSSAFNTFCYETVEIYDGTGNINNSEKDLEHVWADGTYVDQAMQIATGSKCVEVTGNSKWQTTKAIIDPVKVFAPNVQHVTKHYSRDNGDGTVTYFGSHIDGVYLPINVTVNSKKAGPWGKKVLNCQYQFDGKSSGKVTSIVDVVLFQIHSWKS